MDKDACTKIFITELIIIKMKMQIPTNRGLVMHITVYLYDAMIWPL